MQAPVWIRWLYATIPIVAAAIQFFVLNPKWGTPLTRMLVSLFLAYLPTYPITNYYSRRSGFATPWFQRMPLWHHFRRYMRAKITTEEDLDHKTAYIFCCFPHGACTLSHLLTMTDCCGMLSKVHSGARRDLSASILFQIPVLKDILLMLGCVDASSFTAKYNLKRSRSLFIFVGGEKEQLTAAPGVHKIFLKERKGFIKLALQFGTPLVPMYAFGENDAYHTSNFLLGARQWLQRNFQIGICIFWGRFGSILPLNKTPLHVEIGKPIAVAQLPAEAITQEKIDELHAQFVGEMVRLFERTKQQHGVSKETQLEIM